MNVRTVPMGLALFALSSVAVAATPTCVATIENGWVRAAPPGTTTLAAYATVKNPCNRGMVIVGVSARDFVMSMIHETRLQQGISKMRHVRTLPVPARGQHRFAPGGWHIMLMHPRRSLKTGDRTTVTLKLAGGQCIQAEFVVRSGPPR